MDIFEDYRQKIKKINDEYTQKKIDLYLDAIETLEKNKVGADSIMEARLDGQIETYRIVITHLETELHVSSKH